MAPDDETSTAEQQRPIAAARKHAPLLAGGPPSPVKVLLSPRSNNGPGAALSRSNDKRTIKSSSKANQQQNLGARYIQTRRELPGFVLTRPPERTAPPRARTSTKPLTAWAPQQPSAAPPAQGPVDSIAAAPAPPPASDPAPTPPPPAADDDGSQQPPASPQAPRRPPRIERAARQVQRPPPIWTADANADGVATTTTTTTTAATIASDSPRRPQVDLPTSSYHHAWHETLLSPSASSSPRRGGPALLLSPTSPKSRATGSAMQATLAVLDEARAVAAAPLRFRLPESPRRAPPPRSARPDELPPGAAWQRGAPSQAFASSGGGDGRLGREEGELPDGEDLLEEGDEEEEEEEEPEAQHYDMAHLVRLQLLVVPPGAPPSVAETLLRKLERGFALASAQGGAGEGERSGTTTTAC